MTADDELQELALLCRGNRFITLGVLGYLLSGAPPEVVSDALQYAQELRREWLPTDGHLALVEERYGPPGAAK